MRSSQFAMLYNGSSAVHLFAAQARLGHNRILGSPFEMVGFAQCDPAKNAEFILDEGLLPPVWQSRRDIHRLDLRLSAGVPDPVRSSGSIQPLRLIEQNIG